MKKIWVMFLLLASFLYFNTNDVEASETTGTTPVIADDGTTFTIEDNLGNSYQTTRFDRQPLVFMTDLNYSIHGEKITGYFIIPHVEFSNAILSYSYDNLYFDIENDLKSELIPFSEHIVDEVISTVTISVVYQEDNMTKKKDYYVQVTRARANNDNELKIENDGFIVVDQNNQSLMDFGVFEKDNFKISKKLPYDKQSGIKFKASFAETSHATYWVDGMEAKELKNGEMIVDPILFPDTSHQLIVYIGITSEYREERIYTIQINRDAPSEDNELVLVDDAFQLFNHKGTNLTKDGSWNGQVFTLATPFPYDPINNGIRVKVSYPSLATAYIKRNLNEAGTAIGNGAISDTILFSDTYNLIVYIVVVSQSQKENVYEIHVSMSMPDDNQDHTILVRSGNTNYAFTLDKGTNTWSNLRDPLPYSVQEVDLLITPIQSTTAAYSGSKEESSNITMKTIKVNTNQALNYWITTQGNQEGYEYKIEFYHQSPNDDHGPETEKIQIRNQDQIIDLAYDGTKRQYYNEKPLLYSTASIDYKITSNIATNDIINDSKESIKDQWITLPILNHTNTVTNFQVTTEFNSKGYFYEIRIVIGDADIDASLSHPEDVVLLGNTLTSLKLIQYDLEKKTYYFECDNRSDLTYTIHNFKPTSSYAKIYYSTRLDYLTANELKEESSFPIGSFNHPTTYYVTIQAEDDQYTTTYTFVVAHRDFRSSDNTIWDIQVNNFLDLHRDFVYNYNHKLEVYDYSYDLPYEYKTINFVSIKYDTMAVIVEGFTTTGEQKLSVGRNEFQFCLRAENGEIGKIYTIVFNRLEGSDNHDLTGLKINQDVVAITNARIDYLLPERMDQSVRIDFEYSQYAHLMEIKNRFYIPLADTITIDVKAGEKYSIEICVKSEKEYVDQLDGNHFIINIYAASTVFGVQDIKLLDKEDHDILNIENQILSFDPMVTEYEFRVPNKVDQFQYQVILGEAFQYAYISQPQTNPYQKNLSVGNNYIYIQVISEYQKLNPTITNQSKIYQVNMLRLQKDVENRLEDLSVMVEGKVLPFTNRSFEPNQTFYYINSVDPSTDKVTIKYQKMSASSIIESNIGTPQALDDKRGEFIVEFKADQNRMILSFDMTSESGTVIAYTIMMCIDQYLPSSVASIQNIGVYTLNDTQTNLLTNFNMNQDYYEVSVRGTVSEVQIDVTQNDFYSNVIINQRTGAQQNLLIVKNTLTVEIQLLAEDGSNAGIYTVFIRKLPLDTDRSVAIFTVLGKDCLTQLIESKPIYLPFGTTSATLVCTPNSKYSTAEYETHLSLSSGKNETPVRIISEDGFESIYHVNIVVDDDTRLADMKVMTNDLNIIHFDPGKQEYGEKFNPIIVPYSCNQLDIIVETVGKRNHLAIIGDGLNSLHVGDNNLEIIVTASSGVSTKYMVYVHRTKASDDNHLLSYINELGESIVVDGTTITYHVNREIQQFNSQIEIPEFATSNIEEYIHQELAIGKNTIMLDIVSQSEIVRTYQIIVYRADNVVDFESINFSKEDATALLDIEHKDQLTLNHPSITIQYGIHKLKFDITLKSIYSMVVINGNKYPVNEEGKLQLSFDLVVGTNEFNIYVESEYASYLWGTSQYNQHISKIYTFQVNRNDLSHDAQLKKLELTDENNKILSLDKAFSADKLKYLVEYIEDMRACQIDAAANYGAAKVTVLSSLEFPKMEDLKDFTKNYQFTIQIQCQSEAKVLGLGDEELIYEITLTRGALDYESDNQIEYFEIIDGKGKVIFDKTKFNPDILEYDVTMLCSGDNFTIKGHPRSKYTLLNFVGTGDFILPNQPTSSPATYDVYAESYNHKKSSIYMFHITFRSEDTDASLNSISIDGKLLDSFDKNQLHYQLPKYEYAKTSLDIEVVLGSFYASVKGTGTIPLRCGNNILEVEVTAENGNKKIYTIEVERAFFVVSTPEEDLTKYVYDGTLHTYQLLESDYYTIEGITKSINAIDTVITIKLNKPDEYIWDTTQGHEDLVYHFIVLKNTYDMSSISMISAEYTYDGKSHGLSILGALPNGVSVAYVNNDQVNAGTYTVIATFKGNPNYHDIPDLKANLIINKVKVLEPQADQHVYTYDGVTNFHYQIETNDLYQIKGTLESIVACDHIVEISLFDPQNYEWQTLQNSDSLTYHFIVKKALYDMSGITFENFEIIYDGNTHRIDIVGNLPEGVSVEYENNNQVNAGEYQVIAHFKGNENYEDIPSMAAKLYIQKALYDISKVQFEDLTVKYDGQPKSIFVSGELPEGITVTYEGNAQITPGRYTITASFSDTNPNYYKIEDHKAQLIILQSQLEYHGDFDLTITNIEGFDPDIVLVVHSMSLDDQKLQGMPCSKAYEVYATSNNFKVSLHHVTIVISNNNYLAYQCDETLELIPYSNQNNLVLQQMDTLLLVMGKTDSPIWMWIIFPILACVILGITGFVIIKRRKNKKEKTTEAEKDLVEKDSDSKEEFTVTEEEPIEEETNDEHPNEEISS